MEEQSSISSSGEVEPSTIKVSGNFSGFSDFVSHGFNRFVKAERYGKKYMLKGLQAQYMGNPFYEELLRKEFDIGISLDHPNIVSFISFEQVACLGNCIVMEFVDGRSLKTFLKEKPSLQVRKQVFRQLIDAMSYYHGKQIVHRDLKPSNILITCNGNNVKLIDFGLSDSDAHTVLKQPAGTLSYSSPEQRQSGVTLDCRSDLYALGVLITDIFPNRYAGVVRKCTRTRREKRYASAAEVLRAVERYYYYRRWVLAVVVVLLSVGGLLWWQHKKMQPQSVEEEPTETVSPTTPTKDTVVIVSKQIEALPAIRQEEVVETHKDSARIDDAMQQEASAFATKAIKEMDAICKDFLKNAEHQFKYEEVAESRLDFLIMQEAYKLYADVEHDYGREHALYKKLRNVVEKVYLHYRSEAEKFFRSTTSLPRFYKEYEAGNISKQEFDAGKRQWDSISKEYYKLPHIYGNVFIDPY